MNGQGKPFFPAPGVPEDMASFFTLDYFNEVANALNADPDFKSKAGSLTATILMVAKDKGQAALLRIEKGSARAEGATADTPADFKFLADYATWAANHRGESPLDKLVLTGKVKYVGSMSKILAQRNQLSIIDRVAQKVPADI